jgi:carbamoyltransferase
MVTVGVSLGHDSGVCLLSGNDVVFAINEERLTRKKGFAGFPQKSLDYLLMNFKEQIDIVAVDGKYVSPHGVSARYNFEGNETIPRRIVRKMALSKVLLGTKSGIRIVRFIFAVLHLAKRRKTKRKIERIFLSLGRHRPKVKFIDHHTAHAYSIMPVDPVPNGSVVLTIDGVGEGICSRVFMFEENRLRAISWQPALGSPATMYAYITKILGFRMNRHEGKITGLAAFGNSTQTKRIIENHFYYDKSRGRFKARKISWGQGGEESLAKQLRNFSPEDIAAGVQDVCEQIVISYLEDLLKPNDFRKPVNLYVSGGLFANVKLNQKIVQHSLVKSLHVAPNMGDGGLALGAAKAIHQHQVTHKDVYLGTSIGSVDVKNSALNLVGTGADLASLVAHKLSEGKIVAVARNRMEYGPRALGNRSILYDASNVNVNSWLNNKLNRTEFMPFAPIGREEDASLYFNLDQGASEYFNMTITCEVTELCKMEAPAVVHVDGTARPQLTSYEVNEFIWTVLTKYKELTGRGLLVNTSFNMHEEPIVCSSYDAISSFLQAELDLLVLGDKAYERVSNSKPTFNSP